MGALSRLPLLTSLTGLVISDGMLTAALPKKVSRLTNLRVLCLNYGRKMYSYIKGIPEGHELKHLSSLTNLIGLSIPHSSKDNLVTIMTTHTRLQRLHVGRCELDKDDLISIIQVDKRFANLLVNPMHAKAQKHILVSRIEEPDTMEMLVKVYDRFLEGLNRG